MIENGLIGKVVKTDNYHFIGFLYPDFPFVGHLAFNNDIKGIIYTGKEHLRSGERRFVSIFHSKEYLNGTGIPFISTYSLDGKYDVDLTDRKTVLDLVYSRWGFDYTHYVDVDILESLLNMDDPVFYDFIKLCWLSKKRCTNIGNMGFFNSKSIPKLLQTTIENAFAEILQIDSDICLKTLEQSIVHFIRNSKAKNYKLNKKDSYNIMLKSLDISTDGKENELAIILSKYRNMNHNIRIKLIWLIGELKRILS